MVLKLAMNHCGAIVAWANIYVFDSFYDDFVLCHSHIIIMSSFCDDLTSYHEMLNILLHGFITPIFHKETQIAFWPLIMISAYEDPFVYCPILFGSSWISAIANIIGWSSNVCPTTRAHEGILFASLDTEVSCTSSSGSRIRTCKNDFDIKTVAFGWLIFDKCIVSNQMCSMHGLFCIHPSQFAMCSKLHTANVI